MAVQHSGNAVYQMEMEEHQGELNAKRVSLVSSATIFAVINGSVTVKQGDSPWVSSIPSGVTAYQGTSPWVSSILGNVTISDSKGFIGLVTVVQSSTSRSIVGNLTLSDSKGFIGLTTTTLGASPAFVGIVTIANQPALVAGVAYVGLVTVDIGTQNGVAVKGNVTLSDAKTFIGLTTTTLGASPAFIGIATTINAASPAFIGIVTVAGIGTVTLADPKGFIGLTTTTLGSSPAFVGIVTVAGLVPGTAATSLGKAEDAGHTTGDTGVMILGVRNDNGAALVNTDLDYAPIATDSAGMQKVRLDVADKNAMIYQEADGEAAGGATVRMVGLNYTYNGASWDRQRTRTSNAFSFMVSCASGQRTQFPSNTAYIPVKITVQASNNAPAYIGSSGVSATVNGMALPTIAASNPVEYAVTNTNQLWLANVTGTVAVTCWMGIA